MVETVVKQDYKPIFEPGSNMVTFKFYVNEPQGKNLPNLPNLRIIETDPPVYTFTCYENEEEKYSNLLRGDGINFHTKKWVESKPTYLLSYNLVNYELFSGKHITYTLLMKRLADVEVADSLVDVDFREIPRIADCCYNFQNVKKLVIDGIDVNPEFFTYDSPLRIYASCYSTIVAHRNDPHLPVEFTIYLLNDKDRRVYDEINDVHCYYRSGAFHLREQLAVPV